MISNMDNYWQRSAAVLGFAQSVWPWKACAVRLLLDLKLGPAITFGWRKNAETVFKIEMEIFLQVCRYRKKEIHCP